MLNNNSRLRDQSDIKEEIGPGDRIAFEKEHNLIKFYGKGRSLIFHNHDDKALIYFVKSKEDFRGLAELIVEKILGFKLDPHSIKETESEYVITII